MIYAFVTIPLLLGAFMLWRRYTFSGIALLLYSLKLVLQLSLLYGDSLGLAAAAIGILLVLEATVGTLSVLVIGALFDVGMQYFHIKRHVFSKAFIWSVFLILFIPVLIFLI